MIETPLSIPLPLGQGFIEEAQWHASGELPLRVNGWIYFGPDRPWKRVIAKVDQWTEFSVGIRDRPDVANALEKAKGATRTGFELQLPVLPVDTVLLLEAELPDESRISLIDLPVALIPGRSALVGDYHHRIPLPASQLPSGSTTPAEPGFNVIIPVYRPAPYELRECLDSLIQQYHQNWHAVVVDDGSDDPEVTDILEDYAARDSRFSIFRQLNHGIARASNVAINSSHEPWICFLDQDDRLYPEALAVFAQSIRTNPELEVLYSDEEKITQAGDLHSPMLKPGWSPRFLQGTMYCGHLLCLNRAILPRTGLLSSLSG